MLNNLRLTVLMKGMGTKLFLRDIFCMKQDSKYPEILKKCQGHVLEHVLTHLSFMEIFFLLEWGVASAETGSVEWSVKCKVCEWMWTLWINGHATDGPQERIKNLCCKLKQAAETFIPHPTPHHLPTPPIFSALWHLW